MSASTLPSVSDNNDTNAPRQSTPPPSLPSLPLPPPLPSPPSPSPLLQAIQPVLPSTPLPPTNPPNLTPEDIRNRFFNVVEPFTLTTKEFEEQWPYVSNVWTSFNVSERNNGDRKKIWICRFNKYRKSSTRREGVPVEKQRKRKIREPDMCSAKIRTTFFAEADTVRVERFGPDTPDHTHSIDESDRIKRPQIIRDLVAREARKPNAPPAIVKTVVEQAMQRFGMNSGIQYLDRKEVANIKLKVKGPKPPNETRRVSSADMVEGGVKFVEEDGFGREKPSPARSGMGIFTFTSTEELETQEAEKRRMEIEELIGRVRETYKRFEDRRNPNETTRFVARLKESLGPILDAQAGGSL